MLIWILLIMRESQFDELCGLRQIALSWAKWYWTSMWKGHEIILLRGTKWLRGSCYAPSQNYENRILVSLCLFVRPSVCQSSRNNSVPSGRTFMIFDIRDFSKICPENPKFIKIWKDNGYIIGRRMHIYRDVSLNSLNDKCFQTFQLQRKSNTHLISRICFLICKSCLLWDNVGQVRGGEVQPDRPQMTIQYGTCALHAV